VNPAELDETGSPAELAPRATQAKTDCLEDLDFLD